MFILYKRLKNDTVDLLNDSYSMIERVYIQINESCYIYAIAKPKGKGFCMF